MWTVRKNFEEWVNDSRMLHRSTDAGHSDDYCHPWTMGAWAAWQEQNNRSKPDPVSEVIITKESWENAINGLGGYHY